MDKEKVHLNNMDLLKRLPEEDNEEKYLWRIHNYIKQGLFPNWKSINETVNHELGYYDDRMRDESCWRKKAKYADIFYHNVFCEKESDEYINELREAKRELEREKVKLRDERTEYNKKNRIEARVEQKLDYLEEAMQRLCEKRYEPIEQKHLSFNEDDKSLVVMLSDLHIGETYDNNFGRYDSDIAKRRLDEYLEKAIELGKKYDVEEVYVVGIGDQINASIHKTLQITNRENVVDQLELVMEYIGDFVFGLAKNFKMVYYQDNTGNHSRLDRKEDALHDERLDKLSGLLVKNMKKYVHNVKYLDNKIDSGIGVLNIYGKEYFHVHGDFDKFDASGVQKLCMMTKRFPYAIMFGHLHTNAFNDISDVKIIRGGSLSGAGGQYCIEKRITGEPSQMMFVVDKNGIVSLNPVVFDKFN